MNIFGPFEQIFISPDIYKSVKYKLYILFIKPPSHHFCNKIKHLYLKGLKFENNYRLMSPPTFRMMKSIPSPFLRLQFVTLLSLLSSLRHCTALTPRALHPMFRPQLTDTDSTHAVRWPYSALYSCTHHCTVQWIVHTEIFLPLLKLPPNQNKP